LTATTRVSLLLTIVAASVPILCQREPVLKQIDTPHPYYYREMYLPQLTTGPGAVAWLPDSQTLVYSMAGSLWKQRIGSASAQQLTAGLGYDYQPDCSHDGRWVIYASYYKDAVELWSLDLQSGQTKQLTDNHAVNVEARFSPDGKRVAFVSTSFHGRFHIFLAEFADGQLSNVQRLTGENRTSLPRYYYSVFDHEISPVWSPDGSEILFVSNRGHLYGTGGFWRMKPDPGAEAREIHYEETTWKARPDFSPDGKRIVYSSYIGQQWNQLWLMPSDGGDPFALSYGDFDNVGPRWSPDGTRIAFISNRGGNTSLWTQQVPGGAQTQVTIGQRHYLRPMSQLRISVLDAAGHPTAARIFVTGEDTRAYAPDNGWMNADDNFNRAERPFEAHYFHTTGTSQLSVPSGRVEVEVMKGFELRFEKRTLHLGPHQNANLTVRVTPLSFPQSPATRWVSSDVHVHMNYGGHYRNTPKHLVEQAAAENLAIVQDLVVNKEQRIPDIAYFRTTPDPASTASNLLLHAQEYHTSYWGHLGLLHLTNNFILPGYAAYANTAAASLVPTNADVADLAHQQQGLVGYVHPFDTVPDPAHDQSLTDELPVDVALGKVDYIEALGFSDHKATAEVWYRLLNCGFHLPAAAGTDAMANFASLRGPVGLNRVYAEVPKGPLDAKSWLRSLKQGRTFASNGPLIGFSLGGHAPGDELKLPAGQQQVKFHAWLRSIVPIDHLQIVCNGKVVRELTMAQHDSADIDGTLPITNTHWCLLRGLSDKSEHPILDAYPYATTSPIYVTGPVPFPYPKEEADYFIAWIDRLTSAANAHQGWNTDAEKESVLKMLRDARAIYGNLGK
jgi:TolB protein